MPETIKHSDSDGNYYKNKFNQKFLLVDDIYKEKKYYRKSNFAYLRLIFQRLI